MEEGREGGREGGILGKHTHLHRTHTESLRLTLSSSLPLSLLLSQEGGTDGMDVLTSSSNPAPGITNSSSSSSTVRLRHGPPSVTPSLPSSPSLKDIELISPVNERGLSLEGGGREEGAEGGGGGGGGLKQMFKANPKAPSSSGLSGRPTRYEDD